VAGLGKSAGYGQARNAGITATGGWAGQVYASLGKRPATSKAGTQACRRLVAGLGKSGQVAGDGQARNPGILAICGWARLGLGKPDGSGSLGKWLATGKPGTQAS